jgi:hypothetical protein
LPRGARGGEFREFGIPCHIPDSQYPIHGAGVARAPVPDLRAGFLLIL